MATESSWDVDVAGPGEQSYWDLDVAGPGELSRWDFISDEVSFDQIARILPSRWIAQIRRGE